MIRRTQPKTALLTPIQLSCTPQDSSTLQREVERYVDISGISNKCAGCNVIKTKDTKIKTYLIWKGGFPTPAHTIFEIAYQITFDPNIDSHFVCRACFDSAKKIHDKKVEFQSYIENQRRGHKPTQNLQIKRGRKTGDGSPMSKRIANLGDNIEEEVVVRILFLYWGFGFEDVVTRGKCFL